VRHNVAYAADAFCEPAFCGTADALGSSIILLWMGKDTMVKGFDFDMRLRPRGTRGCGIRRAVLCCAGLAALFGASPERVAAQAQAVAPTVKVTPTSLNFPQTAAGAISAAQVVTVNNTSNVVLNLVGLQVAGSPLPDFSYNTSCVLPLPAGGNCVININFTPLIVGPRTARLLINDDAMDSPQSVALTGVASDPYAISASGATSAAVNAGQTALYNLQFTPASGFFGSVQIQCSGAPRGAACTTNPENVAVVTGANGPVPFVVKVVTSSTNAGAADGAAQTAKPGTYTLLVAAVWGTISKKIPLTLTVQ
jgi:hypothetical protein